MSESGSGEADHAEAVLARVIAGAGPIPEAVIDVARGLSDWIDPEASIATLVEASVDLVRHPRLVQHTYQLVDLATLTLQMRPLVDGLEVIGLIEPTNPTGTPVDEWDCRVESPSQDAQSCRLERGTFTCVVEDGGLFRLRVSDGVAVRHTPWIDNPPDAHPPVEGEAGTG